MATMTAEMLINRKLQDLNPLSVGLQQCPPGHSYGPRVRKYTLIHYVLRGCGVFEARGRRWPVKAGEAFLILPGEVTTYTADTENPWQYQWIGFDGALAARFARLPPVFRVSESTFRALRWEDEQTEIPEYLLAAGLFRLYSELFAQPGKKRNPVQLVQDYVRSCYMQKVSVEDLARQLHMDRRYLSRLFKRKTGVSIQEYIVQVRMEESKGFLRRGCSVQEAAQLCGYDDAAGFSRIFKKHCGVSPANWKKAAEEDLR